MLTHLLLQSGQRGVERSFEHFVKTHPDLKPESKYNSFINNDFGHTTFTKHVNSLYVSTNLHSLTFLDTPGCSRRLLSAYRVCSQVNVTTNENTEKQLLSFGGQRKDPVFCCFFRAQQYTAVLIMFCSGQHGYFNVLQGERRQIRLVSERCDRNLDLIDALALRHRHQLQARGVHASR